MVLATGLRVRDPRAGLRAWEGIIGAATGHYTRHPAEGRDRPSFSALPLASTFGALDRGEQHRSPRSSPAKRMGRGQPVAGPPAPVPIRRTSRRCASVREAVGDAYCLMLDSAWAYSYKEALDVGFAIEDVDYHWYEDPLGADDIDGYVKLKQHLSIPIVATEITGGGLYSLPRWIAGSCDRRAARRCRHQRWHHGMMKIAALAEAHHLPCEVHDAYNAIGNVATVHVVDRRSLTARCTRCSCRTRPGRTTSSTSRMAWPSPSRSTGTATCTRPSDRDSASSPIGER